MDTHPRRSCDPPEEFVQVVVDFTRGVVPPLYEFLDRAAVVGLRPGEDAVIVALAERDGVEHWVRQHYHRVAAGQAWEVWAINQ